MSNRACFVNWRPAPALVCHRPTTHTIMAEGPRSSSTFYACDEHAPDVGTFERGGHRYIVERDADAPAWVGP